MPIGTQPADDANYDECVELDADDPRHSYLRIADDLRKGIASGELQPGAKLPTARSLMTRYGAASHTVQSALNVLQSAGLTYSVHGRGTFVRDDFDPAALLGDNEVATGDADVASAVAELTGAVRALEDRVTALSEEIAAVRDAVSDRERLT